MNCPTCSAVLEAGQKFCIQCGTNVAALTLPAPPAGPVGPADPAPPTVAIKPTVPPTVAAPTALPPPPGPDAFAIVEQAPSPQQWTGGWTSEPDGVLTAENARTSTQAMPYAPVNVVDVLSIPARGSTVLAVVAGIAGLAVVIGGFVPVLNIETDAPIADVGAYRINDLYAASSPLGTNVLLGFVIAGLCMIGGGVLAMLGRRIGAGLAAGAALITIPVAIVVWGAIDLVSKRAEQNAFTVAAAGGGGTYFRSKQDVGLFVVLGGAAVGIVAVVIAAIQSGNDGRPKLNLGLGVAGAVASVLAATGQMIPGTGRSFSDNFNGTFGTHPVVDGRLGVIVVVAGTGIFGFLRSNRWGIGLAVGGASIWVWQWLSSLAALGDAPTPPGYFAVGGTDLKPHIVTTIGVVTMLVIALVVMITAPKPLPATPDA